MIHFVIKKMLNNKWLFFCLCFGSILVNALICSIPIYTNAVQERMLSKKLEAVQVEETKLPGEIKIQFNIFLHRIKENPMEEYDYIENEVIDPLIKALDLPILATRREVSTKQAYLYSTNRINSLGRNITISDSLWAVENMENHIKVIGGSGFSQEPKEYLELMIEKVAYSKIDISIGEEFYLCDQYEWNAQGELPQKYYKARLVGVYEKVDDGSGFWQMGNTIYNDGLLVAYDVMMNQILKERNNWFNDATWYICTDYQRIQMKNSAKLVEALGTYRGKLMSYLPTTKFTANYEVPIKKCQVEREELKNTIILFMIPVILMLIFFVFMITQLIVISEHNEIAVLKSRGASKKNIFSIYFIESLLISILSMVIGPLLGSFICGMIGSTSGFLEFVGRKALSIKINQETYIYASIAQSIFISSMLIPAVIYSNVNIVEHKRTLFKQKKPFWSRVFLDVICIGVSLYYYSWYVKEIKKLETLGIAKSEVGIDPILYLISTLFILGLSLLFLRGYPHLIRFVFMIRKERWQPIFYAAFSNISRIKGSEQFIMIFMMMAVGIGVLNANEARSYNQNKEDQIRYSEVSDVVLTPKWKDFNAYVPLQGAVGESGGGLKPDYWKEPDNQRIKNIEGIEGLCKVVNKKADYMYIGENIVSEVPLYVMAFEPSNFGKVTWFKSNLLPVHINEYLNIMTKAPYNIFLTSNVEKYYEVKVGDTIQIAMTDSKGFELGQIKGVIAGFVDYWPGITDKETQVVALMNYTYLYNNIGVVPYDYYIKKEEGLSDKTFIQNLEKSDVEYTDVRFTDSSIVETKNHPLNMGMNGVLTLGFIVIMLITAVGFLMYWLLEIKSRSLQFGVMRAIGLGSMDILKIIVLEQVLLFGISILAGILFGSMASELFIPLLQAMNEKAQRGYPGSVSFSRKDYVNIYVITMIILGTSSLVIFSTMRKIKVAQILKLGED